MGQEAHCRHGHEPRSNLEACLRQSLDPICSGRQERHQAARLEAGHRTIGREAAPRQMRLEHFPPEFNSFGKLKKFQVLFEKAWYTCKEKRAFSVLDLAFLRVFYQYKLKITGWFALKLAKNLEPT